MSETSTGAVYLCIKQFNARLGDELNLKIGDKVEVLADDSEYNDGWYMGKNMLTNEVGLYPKSFTQLLQTPSGSLLRSRSRRVTSKGLSASNITEKLDKLSVSKPAEPTVNEESKSGLTQISEQNPKNSNSSAATDTVQDIDRALEELQTPPAEIKNPYKDIKPVESKLVYQSQPLGFQAREANAAKELPTPVSNDPPTPATKKASHSTEVTPETQHQLLSQSRSQPQQQPALSSQLGRNGSLSSVPNPSEAHSWSPKDVSAYFSHLGFDSGVSGKFLRHEITGAILFELDLGHLKELDIDSFGVRFQIHKEIEKLKQIAAGEVAARNAMPSSSSESLLSPKVSQSFNSYNNSDDDRGLMPSAPLSRKREKGDDVETPPMPFVAPQRPHGPLSPDEQVYHDKLAQAQDEFGTPTTPNTPRTRNAADAPEHHLYLTRNNALSAGLGINGMSRPASSIYEPSVGHSRNALASHRRNSLVISGHKRHSSLFSFLSGNENERERLEKIEKEERAAQAEKEKQRAASARLAKEKPSMLDETADISKAGGTSSPKKAADKRAASDLNVTRLKTLRTASSQNFRGFSGLKKLKTSAFTEGIRQITPDEAIKLASFSGWMSKKSGSTIGWRSRYFTLHGTRLLYFTSLKDKKERGLIDITAHKVIPINSDDSSSDKYIAMYASSTGFGRYCFKLVPPAPGFKKGLTFTQPKTHFFAVETQDEMRGWLKALMTATIDIDDTVPVVSSCLTPTVSLSKAQELLERAREENKLRDEQLADYSHIMTETSMDNHLENETDQTLEEALPMVSYDESASSSQPKLSLDTSVRNTLKGPKTPQMSQSSGGFSSPYLLASGVLSPRLGTHLSPSETPQLGLRSQHEYFPETTTPKLTFSSSNGRVVSQGLGYTPFNPPKKKRGSDKMLSYASDALGNHTFVLKASK